MIKINDNYYEINLIDIIKELKEQLSLNGVYLFNKIKDLPEDLMVSCPFHKEGQERKPSCGIRKNDGWVHCFSCGESCSLEQLIGRCFGYDDLGQFGYNWLRKNILSDYSEKRIISGIDFGESNSEQVETIFVLDKELNEYRYYHSYMYKRKLTDEVINKFDIGYDKKTDCITFPVRDEKGNCLFVARRSVKSKFFNYPTNIEKPVYGLYELPKGCDEVIICESMINALTCYVYRKTGVSIKWYRYKISN